MFGRSWEFVKKCGKKIKSAVEHTVKSVQATIQITTIIGQAIFNMNRVNEVSGFNKQPFVSIANITAALVSATNVIYTRVSFKKRNVPPLDPHLQNLNWFGWTIHKILYGLQIVSGFFAANSVALFIRTLVIALIPIIANLVNPLYRAYRQSTDPTYRASNAEFVMDEETSEKIGNMVIIYGIMFLFAIGRLVQYITFNVIQIGNQNALIIAKKLEEILKNLFKKTDANAAKTNKKILLLAISTTISTLLPVVLLARISTSSAMRRWPINIPTIIINSLAILSMITSGIAHITQFGPTTSRALNDLAVWLKNKFKKNNHRSHHRTAFIRSPHDFIFYTSLSILFIYDSYVGTMNTSELFEDKRVGIPIGAICSSLLAVMNALVSYQGFNNGMGYNTIADQSNRVHQPELDDLDYDAVLNTENESAYGNNILVDDILPPQPANSTSSAELNTLRFSTDTVSQPASSAELNTLKFSTDTVPSLATHHAAKFGRPRNAESDTETDDFSLRTRRSESDFEAGVPLLSEEDGFSDYEEKDAKSCRCSIL